MPYIDTYRWFDTILEPTEGETFTEFHARCKAGIQSLDPNVDDSMVMQTVMDAWSHFVLRNASKVTITMEREMVFDSVYLEGWWRDWKVTEIHSASLPQITFSSTEMATAGSGEVFKIAKSAEDAQQVFGWANVAIDESGQYPIDWDGDITSPEQLEKAAYNFVLKHRVTGEQHEGDAVGELIESVMFTKEKQAAMGIPEGVMPEGWWVGFHIPDQDIFKKIKSGEYQMFSVEGTAKRVPVQ